MENILNSMVIPFVKNVALAIVVLLVGLAVIRRIGAFVGKQVERSKMDDTLKPFMMSLVEGILKVLLVISVIGILGVDIASFVAILAAAGFAVGLAFQGSLSNFAGGILLLIVRPIKVGDYIEANGFSGTVEAIHILNTTLKTPDNKVIYIPNGQLSNASITNYSVKEPSRPRPAQARRKTPWKRPSAGPWRKPCAGTPGTASARPRPWASAVAPCSTASRNTA